MSIPANCQSISIFGPIKAKSASTNHYTCSSTCTPFTWTTNLGTATAAGIGCNVTFNAVTVLTNASVGITDHCGMSGNVQVQIVPPVVNNITLSPSTQNVACGNPGVTLTPSAPSGGDGTYTYQWLSSPDNVTFTIITGATGSTYQPPNPSSPTYYRVDVSSFGFIVRSSIATVTPSIPPLVGGTIDNSAQTIGLNYTPLSLTCTAASGGNCSGGPYTYQWQVFGPNGIIYVNVSGAGSGLSYSPPAITTPGITRYRLQASYSYTQTVNGNPQIVTLVAYSNEALINVLSNLNGGRITPSSFIVTSGTSPGQLTANPATGGNCSGSYTYAWQQSTDQVNWTDLGITTQNYTPPTLTAAAYYRRKVTCGTTDIAYSTISIITVGTPDSVTPSYLRARDIRKPSITDTTTAAAVTSPFDAHQTTEYYNGMGKPIQKVIKQSTPLQKDFVAASSYDASGRESIRYLPYASSTSDGNYKTNPLTEQQTFNTNLFPGEQYFYGQVDFDHSPLGATFTTYSPGSNWVGSSRGVPTPNLTNLVQEGVIQWSIAAAAGSIPSAVSTYGDGLLAKRLSIDEKNKQVISYQDFEGNVILKKVQLADAPGVDHTGWLCTYYVYDDFHRLRFIITPQALTQYLSGTALSSISDELCFRFEYDARNRQIIKKTQVQPKYGPYMMRQTGLSW
jgi:hypothetical protein